jgi:hypothetical protein
MRKVAKFKKHILKISKSRRKFGYTEKTAPFFENFKSQKSGKKQLHFSKILKAKNRVKKSSIFRKF